MPRREDHTELFQLQILIRASSSAESRQLLDFLQFHLFSNHIRLDSLKASCECFFREFEAPV